MEVNPKKEPVGVVKERVLVLILLQKKEVPGAPLALVLQRELREVVEG